MNFTELKLHEKLLEAISYIGFETATPIQEQVIPLILQNKDVIACAQTGTGKTAAFVLPILDKLVGKKEHSIDTLIIVPTRELAIQIDQQIQGFSYFIPAGSIAVYGGGDGKDWEAQKSALKKGTDIIVATPGKLLSHLNMGYIDFKRLKHLVLDEADKMLDMGFVDDILAIISHLPKARQTLMFSATMPLSIRALAKKVLHNPAEISLSISKPAEGADQKAYLVYEEQKIDLIIRILKERKQYDSVLIFTSVKNKITDIVRSLNRQGFPSHGISSNLEQDKREEVVNAFRSKKIRILVATDVMSRGIDVKEINMVINYDVPHDAEDYVHRIGRTARASAKGMSITFVSEEEQYKFKQIENFLEKDIYKIPMPAELGEAPEYKPELHRFGHKKFSSGKGKFKRNKPKK